jgi:hypothetical protein
MFLRKAKSLPKVELQPVGSAILRQAKKTNTLAYFVNDTVKSLVTLTSVVMVKKP